MASDVIALKTEVQIEASRFSFSFLDAKTHPTSIFQHFFSEKFSKSPSEITFTLLISKPGGAAKTSQCPMWTQTSRSAKTERCHRRPVQVKIVEEAKHQPMSKVIRNGL
jgi:hypothetical protein